MRSLEILTIEEKQDTSENSTSLLLMACIKDNFSILLLAITYIAFVYITCNHIIGSHLYKIVISFKLFSIMSILFYLCGLVLVAIKGEFGHYCRIRNIVNYFTIIIVTPLFISSFASYKQSFTDINNFCFDKILMITDYFIHFGNNQLDLILSLSSDNFIIRCFDIIYMSWFIVFLIFYLWMSFSIKYVLRKKFFLSTILVWTFIGSILGTIFSSVGPCFYNYIEEENPYHIQMGILKSADDSVGLFAVANQQELWKAKIDNTWLPFGGISAMPSIHVAMSVIFFLTIFNINKTFSILFAVYLILIQIGSVLLGWHYAIDGYIGGLLAFIIWKVVDIYITNEVKILP